MYRGLCIFNTTKCSVIAVGIHELLIAQYEHRLDHSDIQEILPIGVIRCAAAKASPIENLPWVTFPPSGCLKKDNWSNVHAQCFELIKAGGHWLSDLTNFIADVHWSTKCSS